MNIDQLKAFHKVASTGSFTRAAKELFLTQSAVSQQVQSLEYFLGNTLFDRTGKKVYLTGEGKILLSYTNKMFDLYKEIETVCANLRGLQKGKDHYWHGGGDRDREKRGVFSCLNDRRRHQPHRPI